MFSINSSIPVPAVLEKLINHGDKPAISTLVRFPVKKLDYAREFPKVTDK
jgi:hypothetical protein